MAMEWGPWITCDGTGCPEPVGVWMRLVCEIHGELREGEGRLSEADRSSPCWYWRHGSKALRYQLRKPPALTRLQQMIADVPEEVDA